MACPDHEGYQKIMVCVRCKTTVCELCIEVSHNEHSLQTFKTTAKAVISDLLKQTDNQCFTTLEKHLKDISEIRQREGEKADITKQELLNRRDHLKQVVDEVTEAAVTKLDQHNEILFNDLDKAKEKATKQSQQIKDFKDEIERLQSSHNYLEVVEQGWKLTSPEITPCEFPKVSRLAFQVDTPGDASSIEMVFGELLQQDLYAEVTFHPDGTFSTPVLGHYNPDPSPASSICTLHLFGDGPDAGISEYTQQTGTTNVSTLLKMENDQSLKCDVKLTYDRSFEIPSAAILMQPTAEGNCWIGYVGENNNKITLVSSTGEILQDVPCSTRVDGIVVLPVTNQIILACPDKKCVKKVVMKENKYTVDNTKWINTGSLYPLHLCVTTNGDILVTMTDKISWSVEPNSTSVLVKYNNKGKELARAQKDEQGQDLFFVPNVVNTSYTGTVAVINFTSAEPPASYLVVLDNNLNLTYRYISHGITVLAKDQLSEPTGKLYITDVLFNHQNLLIISELYSRTVQLLDDMCNLLKVLVSGQQNIPWSLALHRGGDLWMGLNDNTVQVYKHTCDFTFEQK